MCGIAGIYRLDGSRVDRASLDAMTHTLRHRGPDGEACWIAPDASVGLGHRRLAIVDLSAKGAQPMGRDDRFVITYNGEIYNYVELRRSLCSRGHRFSSESDTEVLLASYQEFGASCLEHLEGMFAFAIWDARDQKLFCARDRFGEKPFHYVYEPGRVFAFASEMKSLFRWGSGRVVRPARLYDYLAYGLLEDARDKGATFFEGIRRLPAAHALTVDARSGLRVDRYWSLPASPRPDPPPRPLERLRLDRKGAHAADLLRTHQARRFQDADVLHRRRERHGQRPRQFTHRQRPATEPLDNGAARRIGEGVEQAIEIGRSVKHMPNYHVANS